MCAQVGTLRQELRKRNLGRVSVCSLEILPDGCLVLGKWAPTLLGGGADHGTRPPEPLLSPGAPVLELFTDAPMLNSVTRAQSQVVAVGDAVALRSLGACSQLWTSFLGACVEHRSIRPGALSLGRVEQSLVQRQHWAQRAESSVAAGAGDPIPEEGRGSPAPTAPPCGSSWMGPGV